MTSQTFEPFDLMNAFKVALKQYKPWHQPHWYAAGAKDPLPVIVEMAEKLGLASPEKPEELGISEDRYKCVRGGGELDVKDRKKVWRALKTKTGLRKPKGPSGIQGA